MNLNKRKMKYMLFYLYLIILFFSCNSNNKRLFVKSKFGKLKKYGESNYILNVSDLDKKGSLLNEISIYKEEHNKKHLISSQIIPCIHLPLPFAFIGSKRKGNIAKNELIKIGEIHANYGEYSIFFNFDYKIEIISFNMIVTKDDKIREINASGSKFSKEQLDLINTLKRGDRILFVDILYRAGNKKGKLQPLVFTIW